MTWVAFAVAFVANLVYAAPAPELPPRRTRVSSPWSGRVVITLATLVTLLWTGRAERHTRYDDVGQPLHSLWPTTR